MNTKLIILPDSTRELLSSPKPRGEGLNNWLFKTARVMHPYCEPDEIISILNGATAGLAIKPGEIDRAVANSKALAWQPGKASPSFNRPPPWPPLNLEQREAVISSHGGLSDLWEASPIRWEDSLPHTEEVIDALFPGNPLLCVGKSNSIFETKRREELRGGLAHFELIVPSPMSALTGKTKEGRTSAHCLGNTGPRRFLVIEQDRGTADEQAAVLLHLKEKGAPLSLVVSSGNKSIHGWFYCGNKDEGFLRSFMSYCVRLGADHHLWVKSQFSRMPGGVRRENGKKQTVFYFNPDCTTGRTAKKPSYR